MLIIIADNHRVTGKRSQVLDVNTDFGNVDFKNNNTYSNIINLENINNYVNTDINTINNSKQ
jgi:hypothetical protein